eukprot:COSAG06_NODE_3140_length_5798_cov_9.196526_2_plen_271_part_00
MLSGLEYLSPTAGDLAIAATASNSEVAEEVNGDSVSDTNTDSGASAGGGSSDNVADVQYELLPTLRNVSRTCGMLLGAEDASTWQDLADLAAWWNALPDDTDDTASTILVSERETAGGSSSSSVSASSKRRRQLAVVEEVRSFRAPHGEEMLHRQHALLSLLPPSVPVAASSSDDNNDDPDLEDPISTSSDGGVSNRAGGGKQGQLTATLSGAGTAAAGGTGRSADPYDVAFPIRPDAIESELAAAAAMESGGGIKLTLGKKMDFGPLSI